MAEGAQQPADRILERLQREASRRKVELDFVNSLAKVRNRKKRDPKAEGLLEALLGPRGLLSHFHGTRGRGRRG